MCCKDSSREDFCTILQLDKLAYFDVVVIEQVLNVCIDHRSTLHLYHLRGTLYVFTSFGLLCDWSRRRKDWTSIVTLSLRYIVAALSSYILATRQPPSEVPLNDVQEVGHSQTTVKPLKSVAPPLVVSIRKDAVKL